MSIFPKKLNKNKDKFTTLHMKISNNSQKRIMGFIKYKITKPNKETETIEIKDVIINENDTMDKYYKYYIKVPQIGRYYVDGRFYWDNQNVLSDTYKNDFFDVE